VNKNSKGFIHLFLLFAFALIIITGIGYYAYKNGQIKLTSQKDISPTPTTPEQKEEEAGQKTGYTGTDPSKQKFILDLPEGCTEKRQESGGDMTVQITCITDNFTLLIDPQAAGRGIYWQGDIIEGKVDVGSYVIDHATYISNENTPDLQTFSHYSLTGIKNGIDNDYQIEIVYDKYSEQAREYADQILSTFKFLARE